MKLEFSRQILENILISNFIKIRLAGVELFHAERRTDGQDEAKGHFSQFFESAYNTKSKILTADTFHWRKYESAHLHYIDCLFNGHKSFY